jgi:thiosulfate reductase cytochrome b subunit
VDCLVCHDSTGKYKKPSGFSGHPVTKDTEFPPGSGKIIRGIDLSAIAQKVGKTRRETCGTCHFYGGGGDAVKHGDLDSSLDQPDKALDVHMDAEGNNFTCATCHKTEGHQVPGSRYAPTAADKGGAHLRGKADSSNPATCQACHGQAPHSMAKLNDHTDKVACQTCHIPAFARGDMPTKMSWDWSTAGKRDAKGKPLVVTNDDGHITYNGIKGDFVLEENVKPEYVWFNGTVNYTLMGDDIDKSQQPIAINTFEGSRRRQVADLAGQAVPRQAALRPHQQDPGGHPPGRRGRHRLLEEHGVGQGRRRGHEDAAQALLGQGGFHRDHRHVADHPHGRAQGQGPGLQRMPRQGRAPRQDRGHLHPRPRRQPAGRHHRLARCGGILAGVLIHGAIRAVAASTDTETRIMERVYLFTRFERLWHWAQAVLIIGMLVTGFEIHGTYNLLGFAQAHRVHTTIVWAFIALWVFAIFWHLTTGEWRQYIPTMKNIDKIVRFYAVGIFRASPPLQAHPRAQAQPHAGPDLPGRHRGGHAAVVDLRPRLPVLQRADAAGYRIELGTIALVHTIGAFLMLAFLIGHIYLGTTGHTPLAHFRAMFTGWDDDH